MDERVVSSACPAMVLPEAFVMGGRAHQIVSPWQDEASFASGLADYADLAHDRCGPRSRELANRTVEPRPNSFKATARTNFDMKSPVVGR